jgi:arsenite-transporting ATPase
VKSESGSDPDASGDAGAGGPRAFHSSPFTLPTSLTLVGGKGGVGKTTTAAALAIHLAARGREVLLLSVDPAHSLGDALRVPLSGDPEPVPGVPGLSALELDAELERSRFLSSHRGALLSLIERGTYLDAADAAGFVNLSIPGLDELAALFRLQALLSDGERHLVVDTAPTGHTLRLLELPEVARGWLAALQAMEDKHRAVSAALVGAVADDDASRLLRELDSDLAALVELFTDGERTGFVLVTGREPVVLAETLRYQQELARRRIHVAGVVVNRATRDGVPPDGADGVPMIFVPPLTPEPVGNEGLRTFARYLARAAVAPRGPEPPLWGFVQVGDPFLPPLDRGLYLVGGKGGVGKSTVAAAIALTLAGEGRRTLLLGADPAGSLGDVLERAVGRTAEPVEGVPGLWARQLEAARSWDDFRAQYRDEAERIFGSLLSGGVSASADLHVVERLIDLAPPGIDELVALVEVVDAMEDRPYDALVLDTAPTGHFVRLLELPDVALGWTHEVMRLLLKYREVVAPGELAERLLQLARTLRRFGERLRDPDSTWTLLVALPEALSLPETARLLQRLRELKIPAGALLANRLLSDGEVRAGHAANAAGLVDMERWLPVAAAPELSPGPLGPGALAAFARSWRTVHRQSYDRPRDGL